MFMPGVRATNEKAFASNKSSIKLASGVRPLSFYTEQTFLLKVIIQPSNMKP